MSQPTICTSCQFHQKSVEEGIHRCEAVITIRDYVTGEKTLGFCATINTTGECPHFKPINISSYKD